MPEIVSICYKPDQSSNPGGFSRVSVTSAQLIVGYGIEGDSKGGHPKRQLNVVGESTVYELRAQGYEIVPGSMGEQIVVSQIDVDALNVGDRLRLGGALIEVTGQRRGCDRFKSAQQNERDDDVALGVMAMVIEGGVIAVGDAVSLEPNPVASV